MGLSWPIAPSPKPKLTGVDRQTVDTLRAASTFLEMMSIWKNNDAEIAAKTKYAKYHALRILKAIKAGEDPNATNPVHDTPEQPVSPPALDPEDPEVQRINQAAAAQPPENPYQPYVESAPDTSVQPSLSLSAPPVSPPPPNLPSAPTGYTHTSHSDVSPISQPAQSRQGSVTSIGGGYVPKTDPPTFTGESAPPGLPTAPMDRDPLTSSLPTSPQVPQAPEASDPSGFYQNTASPPAAAPTQNSYQPPQNQFASPSPQPPQQQYAPPTSAFPPQQQYPPAPHQNPYAQPPPPSQPPQQFSNGPFRNDEDSIMLAQKHAKWAISALNFEDADTAVKELRTALRALGA